MGGQRELQLYLKGAAPCMVKEVRPSVLRKSCSIRIYCTVFASLDHIASSNVLHMYRTFHVFACGAYLMQCVCVSSWVGLCRCLLWACGVWWSV